MSTSTYTVTGETTADAVRGAVAEAGYQVA